MFLLCMRRIDSWNGLRISWFHSCLSWGGGGVGLVCTDQIGRHRWRGTARRCGHRDGRGGRWRRPWFCRCAQPSVLWEPWRRVSPRRKLWNSEKRFWRPISLLFVLFITFKVKKKLENAGTCELWRRMLRGRGDFGSREIADERSPKKWHALAFFLYEIPNFIVGETHWIFINARFFISLTKGNTLIHHMLYRRKITKLRRHGGGSCLWNEN